MFGSPAGTIKINRKILKIFFLKYMEILKIFFIQVIFYILCVTIFFKVFK